MNLVLDGSIALAWALPDERDPASEAVLAEVGRIGALVPALWPLEVANALLQAERRGRISADIRRSVLLALNRLRMTVDDQTHRQAWSATLDIAQTHGLTVYDACYLELALRSRLPLASRDKALRRAAQERGVPVLG